MAPGRHREKGPPQTCPSAVDERVRLPVPVVPAVEAVELELNLVRVKAGMDVSLRLFLLKNVRGGRLIDEVKILVFADLPAVRVAVEVGFDVVVRKRGFVEFIDVEKTASVSRIRIVVTNKNDGFVCVPFQFVFKPFELTFAEEPRGVVYLVERVEEKQIDVRRLDDGHVTILDKGFVGFHVLHDRVKRFAVIMISKGDVEWNARFGDRTDNPGKEPVFAGESPDVCRVSVENHGGRAGTNFQDSFDREVEVFGWIDSSKKAAGVLVNMRIGEEHEVVEVDFLRIVASGG